MITIKFPFCCCILQDKEEKNEDDEPAANVVPKWKAGVVTALHVKTPEEEEEERMMEEAEKIKQQLGQLSFLSR